MNDADVFIVEWGTILRDLQRARPDIPESLINSSVKSMVPGLTSGGYALSCPRSVAIVAAQRFAQDYELPKGRNSTVLPTGVHNDFWEYVEKAVMDAILVWDREISEDVYQWANRFIPPDDEDDNR